MDDLAEVTAVRVGDHRPRRQRSRGRTTPRRTHPAGADSGRRSFVLRQAARAIAHRMRVFAHHQRHRAARASSRRPRARVFAPAERLELASGGYIRLKKSRTRQLGPARRGSAAPDRAPASSRPSPQARPPSRLIAERPDHDARMVLVTLDRPPYAVEQDLGPRRVARRIGPPPPRENPCVSRSHSSTTYSPTGRRVQECGIRRIVARPNSVDVVLLHQADVVLHRLPRDRATATRVEVVTVHAAEDERPPVQQQHPVVDGHRAEPDAQPYGLASVET